MRTIIFWMISWIISALILVPCALLSSLGGFIVDYHHEFHLWWDRKFLSKLN